MQDKTMTITRTGKPPIKFCGEGIGSGSTEVNGGNRANRWTEVDIYQTKGGKFVAAVTNRTIWQGEHDFAKAASFDTAAEVVKWLENDEGHLGSASQEALTKAAENHPEFAAAYCEAVD